MTEEMRDMLIVGRDQDFRDLWSWLAVLLANDKDVPYLARSVERSLAYSIGADDLQRDIDEAVAIVTRAEA